MLHTGRNLCQVFLRGPSYSPGVDSQRWDCWINEYGGPLRLLLSPDKTASRSFCVHYTASSKGKCPIQGLLPGPSIF